MPKALAVTIVTRKQWNKIWDYMPSNVHRYYPLGGNIRLTFLISAVGRPRIMWDNADTKGNKQTNTYEELKELITLETMKYALTGDIKDANPTEE